MPARRIDKAKTKAAQANNHLDMSLAALLELYKMFEPTHKEHAQLIMLVSQSILVCQKQLEEFWVHTWGKLPKTMERFRT